MQRGLQDCWRSAQRWLTLISANNDMGDAGTERLARVLAQCPALAHLDLYKNQIGDTGADSLAGVLGQCASNPASH
jgi:hypothetical protein